MKSNLESAVKTMNMLEKEVAEVKTKKAYLQSQLNKVKVRAKQKGWSL